MINCAMFRGSNARELPGRAGDAVVLMGGMDVYAPQGRLSLIVRSMRKDGAGDMARRLEELKRRLAGEGLFDPDRKRDLPPLPRCVGVATSPTGAALQDVLKVLRQRFPATHVLVSPCKVQGEGSAESVVDAITRLERDGRAEVIIFGRGGGSPRTSWPSTMKDSPCGCRVQHSDHQRRRTRSRRLDHRLGRRRPGGDS